MKALLEVVELKVNDIITTSTDAGCEPDCEDQSPMDF